MSQSECCKGYPVSKVLILLSWICVALAAIGALGVDIYLASTQWILMSVLLAVNALWFHYHKGL